MKRKFEELPEAQTSHLDECEPAIDLLDESMWETIEAVIEGVDQKTCQQAWARLKRHPRVSDLTYHHDGRQIYCARHIDPDIKSPNICILVIDPETENSNQEFDLIKEKDGFRVQQIVSMHKGETSFTNKEIESILNGIIHGEREE